MTDLFILLDKKLVISSLLQDPTRHLGRKAGPNMYAMQVEKEN